MKTENDDLVRFYWQKFLNSLPEDSAYRKMSYQAEGWGDSSDMADELGKLIAAGTKIATCSAVWEWQAEGKTWQEPGFITIVLDGSDHPLCIIETIEVAVKFYSEVDEIFAFDEGEGDRSLAYWRAAHKDYFSRGLPKIGRQFSEDMPLVCERFKLIYNET